MAVKMLVFLAFLLILGGVQKVSGENVTNTTSSAERIDNTTAQEQQPSVAPVVGDNDFSPSKSAEADGVQFSLVCTY